MHTRLLCALAIAFLPVAADQGRRDFTGRWIAVEPEAVAGHELVIAQHDTTLTLEQVQLDPRPAGNAPAMRESTTYRLDGKPTFAMRAADDPGQVRSSARWEGDRLVLTDVYIGTGPLRYQHQRRLAFDERGRLVLTQRSWRIELHPTTWGEPRRIVFERR